MSDLKNSVITNLEPDFLVEENYSFVYAESDRARHTAQYKIYCCICFKCLDSKKLSFRVEVRCQIHTCIPVPKKKQHKKTLILHSLLHTLSLSHTHAHIHPHMHTHTHTQSLTHSLFFTHSLCLVQMSSIWRPIFMRNLQRVKKWWGNYGV
jgi:hypothetical protein